MRPMPRRKHTVYIEDNTWTKIKANSKPIADQVNEALEKCLNEENGEGQTKKEVEKVKTVATVEVQVKPTLAERLRKKP